MCPDQLFVRSALALILESLPSLLLAADPFRKLKGAEIRARFAGKSHRRRTLGRAIYARRHLQGFAYGQAKPRQVVCPQRRAVLGSRKAEPDCREVWISGNKIEFRDTGLEGVLQKQQKRG